MMEWSKMVIGLENINKEVLSAWLHYSGVDSIVETEETFEAYFMNDKTDEILSILLDKMPGLSYSILNVPNQNWNELWESSFSPIRIDDIYIRASFHPKLENVHEILISPKMAFGTGHHETTSMMISYMNRQNYSGKKVLDYGCGTGILCVMAFMKGAEEVYGIDIQSEAIENTIEHFELNGMSDRNYSIQQGDLDVLTNLEYDIILANINRHVLSLNQNNLYSLLDKDGTLLVSGIMKNDKELIISIYKEAGFKLKDEMTKGDWCLFVFNK